MHFKLTISLAVQGHIERTEIVTDDESELQAFSDDDGFEFYEHSNGRIFFKKDLIFMRELQRIDGPMPKPDIEEEEV